MKPMAEQLEERNAASSFITYNGGPLLTHVEVNEVFTAPQVINVDDALKDFVVAYLPLATPQFGIGAGTVNPNTFYGPAVTPGNNTPSRADIEAYLTAHLDNGNLPAPNAQSLYFVLLYPGQTVSDLPYDQGYHSAFAYRGKEVPYAVVLALADPKQLSGTISHELIEAATDPVPLTGFADARQNAIVVAQEIADVYFPKTAPLNGTPYSVALFSDLQGNALGVTVQPTPLMPFNYARSWYLADAFFADLVTGNSNVGQAQLAMAQEPSFFTAAGQAVFDGMFAAFFPGVQPPAPVIFH